MNKLIKDYDTSENIIEKIIINVILNFASIGTKNLQKYHN